jgi:hypothetical protein
VAHRGGGESVPALVVRRDQLLLVAHDARAALRTGDDAVDRLVERAVVDQLRVGACREQRGLVEDVREVGTGEARGLPGDDLEVDSLGERLAAAVHLEDALAAEQVGSVDADLAVEAAGAQQRRVEDVGAVGRGDQDDVRLDVEAVHLDEELVERLLALVVAAAHAGTAVTADGVDLVDEDDGRRVLLRLLEQVAHAARADSDEHLDEVGARDGVERHARLSRDGAGEQGLAGPGRAVEEHALRDPRTDGLELRGLLQELLDLVQLLDGLVGTGDVLERDLRRLLRDQLRLRLAELHDAVAAALHAREHQPEERSDQEDREQEAERGQEPVGLRDLVVVAVRRVGRGHGVDDLGAARSHVVELHLRAVVAVGLRERQVDPLLPVDDLRRLDLAVLQQLEALLRADLPEPGHRDQRGPDPHRDDREDDVENGTPEDALDVHECCGSRPGTFLTEKCECQATSRTLNAPRAFAVGVRRVLRLVVGLRDLQGIRGRRGGDRRREADSRAQCLQIVRGRQGQGAGRRRAAASVARTAPSWAERVAGRVGGASQRGPASRTPRRSPERQSASTLPRTKERRRSAVAGATPSVSARSTRWR